MKSFFELLSTVFDSIGNKQTICEETKQTSVFNRVLSIFVQNYKQSLKIVFQIQLPSYYFS